MWKRGMVAHFSSLFKAGTVGEVRGKHALWISGESRVQAEEIASTKALGVNFASHI